MKHEQKSLASPREMLQPSAARTTEGREAFGPLFTQEADARIRAEIAGQRILFQEESWPTRQ